MRKTVLVALAAASLVGLPALSTSATADETVGSKKVCATAPTGFAACHAHVRTKGAKPDATTSYQSGYSPAQLVSAYKLGSFSGTATVAIVDAYNNPNAAKDLQAYRTQFGLGTANLTILNQNGVQGSYAAGDTGWGQEEMLDLEMVSAICPGCPILYVGANSASFADLGTAVNTAVAKGALIVSNSYGGSESSGELSLQTSYYTHPGVTQTVSSGDNGYGVESPAAFSTVTAVGGTSLTLNADGTRKSETVWSGAGSGCSAYIAKPSWQKDTGCARRTVADVSAVADPNTGVAVYDSYGSTGGANWYVFGGTSVAAPLIGAVYARTGHAGDSASTLYTSSGSLFDVMSGTNTRRCRAGYLCSGAVGYDGPTGNGTPNGLAAAF